MKKLSYSEGITCSGFIQWVKWKARIPNQACLAQSLSYCLDIQFNKCLFSAIDQTSTSLQWAEEFWTLVWLGNSSFLSQPSVEGQPEMISHEQESQSRTQRQEFFRCYRSHNFEVILLPMSISFFSFQQSIKYHTFHAKSDFHIWMLIFHKLWWR